MKTAFQVLRRIESIERAFNESRNICIAFGAKEEQFQEAGQLLAKIKAAVLKKVSGGIIESKNYED